MPRRGFPQDSLLSRRGFPRACLLCYYNDIKVKSRLTQQACLPVGEKLYDPGIIMI